MAMQEYNGMFTPSHFEHFAHHLLVVPLQIVSNASAFCFSKLSSVT